MSQWDEDAGVVGDELAQLVKSGRLSDAEALGYLAGGTEARERVAAVLGESWHGTPGGYSNHNCRCDDCRKAWREWRRSKGWPRGTRPSLQPTEAEVTPSHNPGAGIPESTGGNQERVSPPGSARSAPALGVHPPSRKSICGHRKCRRLVTQAFDVGSWWSKSVFHGDNANVVHYEVCDKHADYFTGNFDRQASERVVKDIAPWRPATPPREGYPSMTLPETSDSAPMCQCKGKWDLFIWRGDPEWWSCVACDGRVRPLTEAEKATTPSYGQKP